MFIELIKLLSKRTFKDQENSGIWFPDPEKFQVIQQLYSNDLSNHQLNRLSEDFTASLSFFDINGMWKTTSNNRLRKYDAKVIEILKKTNTKNRIEFLDIGASDGCTTLYFLEQIKHNSNFENIRTLVMDKYLYLNTFSFLRIKEYRASDGTRILLRIGPIGLRLPGSAHSKGLISRFFAILYSKQSCFSNRMKFIKKYLLLNPKIRLISNISAVECDIIKFNNCYKSKFDIIRASNTLNLSYFPVNDLKCAIKNIFKYLTDGGILVVSNAANGSIWQKKRYEFFQLSKLGKGSEIDLLIKADYV